MASEMFTESELGSQSVCSNLNRLFCDHCQEHVHRSTFYRHKKLRLEAAEENESRTFDTDLDSDSDSHRSFSSKNGDEIEGEVQDTYTDYIQLDESEIQVHVDNSTVLMNQEDLDFFDDSSEDEIDFDGIVSI